tara:strand:+ start:327 stop:521 length:195 start_codon:yes stop_codon:yes gene_type:complete
MNIHCTINSKNEIKPKNGNKAIKVEYIKNDGYWAKWYEAYNNKHAKALFMEENPNSKYCRCKQY